MDKVTRNQCDHTDVLDTLTPQYKQNTQTSTIKDWTMQEEPTVAFDYYDRPQRK